MPDLAPVFRRALGTGFDRLPPQLRQMHDIAAVAKADGVAEIIRGRSPTARVIGRLAGLPAAGSEVPVTVLFAPRDGAELWRRTFGGVSFQTILTASPDRCGHLVERLGPMRFLLRVPIDDQGLIMVLVRMTVFGLPVPKALWPAIEASERVEQGQFAFDVSVSAPLGGLIIRYRGRLQPPRPVPAP